MPRFRKGASQGCVAQSKNGSRVRIKIDGRTLCGPWRDAPAIAEADLVRVRACNAKEALLRQLVEDAGGGAPRTGGRTRRGGERKRDATGGAQAPAAIQAEARAAVVQASTGPAPGAVAPSVAGKRRRIRAKARTVAESAGTTPPPGAVAPVVARKKRRICKKAQVRLAPLLAPPCQHPLAGASNASQGVAPIAAPVAGLTQVLTLCGLNIQWPFSQLLLAGIKTKEVRNYALQHRRKPHVSPGEEVWLIETPGTGQAPKNAIVRGARIGGRPDRAQIVGTVTFSRAVRYTSVAAFRKDARSHCIAKGGDKDWNGAGELYAWRVAEVKALQTPIPDPQKTMTGMPTPTPFAVTFAMEQHRQGGVEAEVVPGAWAEATLGHFQETSAPSTATLAAEQHRPGGVEAEGAPGTSAAATPGQFPATPAPCASTSYFEAQDGAWCGMHVLNNYLGGPYVTQDACRRAARRAAAALSEAGLGDAEALQNHIDLATGFLSIEVINILGAGTLGLHVEEAATSWSHLQAERPGAAFVNWNNQHWTLLHFEHDTDVWVHTNSICGDGPHCGRARCSSEVEVASLLEVIEHQCGGYSLHRITHAMAEVGPHFLENEGLRSMVGPETIEAEGIAAGGADGACVMSMELSLVTVNVDGLGTYTAPPAARMEEILTAVLAATPDVLLLQEMIMEMYAVLQRRLAAWRIYRRRDVTEDYFNVTAVKSPPASTADKTSSYAFPSSNNGRHVLTVRRHGWTVANAHAESGRRQEERDEREVQLQYLSRLHERENGNICVLAGDLNAREGEDLCLRTEGWRDLWTEAPGIDVDNQQEPWTWRRGANSARYDRFYAQACGPDSVECAHMEAIRSIWPARTDHVALHVVLRRRSRANARSEAAGARVQLARSTARDASAPDSAAKPAGGAQAERRPSGRQREDIPVVKIANAILALDDIFHKRARLCLAHADDGKWTPEDETLEGADQVVAWTCLPAHGGFAVGYIGNRGKQRQASDAEKVAQSHVYTKYKTWAAEACGVTEAELRGHLATASALPKHRRGVESIPVSMRRTLSTVRHHAVLLCRTAGLRKAIATAAPVEIGGSEFAAHAAEQLERILALRDREAEKECKDIRLELWGKESFNLQKMSSQHSCTWVPALFRVWLRREGARLMGAAATWHEMLRARPAGALDAPLIFSLDGAQWNPGIPSHLNSYKVRRGEASLIGAWWRVVWHTVCHEVSERYGERPRIHCKDSVTGVVVHCTFLEMYLKLHAKPTDNDALHLRDAELLAVWRELRANEARLGREIRDLELGRFKKQDSNKDESIFDARTISTIWAHLVLAEQDGRWDALDYGDASAAVDAVTAATTEAEAASPEPDADVKITSLPREAVESFEDGWYKWRGYWKQAGSLDEAHALLNAEWRDLQLRSAHAKRLADQRKTQLQRLEAGDDRYSRGHQVTLKHPRYKLQFRGRLCLDGSKLTFVEDATWYRVTIELPAEAKKCSREFDARRDTKLYNAVRAEHVKANRKASKAARQEAMALQLPKVPGDMGIKKITGGRWMYTWEGAEVEVTPRKLRPQAPEGASAWKRARARETTPERALRKMTEKIKTRFNKAARGEHERIVARTAPADAQEQRTHAGEQTQSSMHAHCPAMAQLDDPVVLCHLRAAYVFLGSAELHHCENCDEEWVIFTGDWPQGGVACAGPKAGKCETILRAGYMASWAKQTWCSRCASSAVYRTMFSEANLQHLGPRDEALSNLTWYESLLIARVHPVISVVTLTATGLLCYAGHVCNYYVKVLDWFRGLPAALRDKKWFLIKRRKSILATGGDVRQKKPTTANRRRLEAAIVAAQRLMPRVYADSVVLPGELAKFPWDEEKEMLDHEERVDMSGDVRLDRSVFSEWLRFGLAASERCRCAAALMRYAVDQQGFDLRGAVTGDTAWELCCRLLSQPADAKSLGTRELAQLLVYWLEERQLPTEMGPAIYQGMLEELHERGKRVETLDDEQAMKSRWVKQLIHGELDLAREAWLGSAKDAPVDLELDFEMQEPQQMSMAAESEQEAAKVLNALAVDGAQGVAGQSCNTNPMQQSDDWYECGSWGDWEDCADAGDWDGDWFGGNEACDGEAEGEAPPELSLERPSGTGPAAPGMEAAVASGTAAEVPAGRGGTPTDRPLVDPPEFGDRIRDTDKEPHWIPGAFPTVFQNETGDPYNYVLKEVDLILWGPHVLRSKGWHAQAHMTFMYWWMNMIQRFQALSAKKWYVRDNPKATGYTVEDLSNMSVKALAKQMVGYTTNIPGTKASKARLRKVILAMVRQIEIETRRGDAATTGADGACSLGDVPCLFGTLTSQRYLWDEVIRIIAQVEGIDEYKSLNRSKRRELVNKYPLFVAWYCSVRLELTLKTIVVPLFGGSAYVAVFEWSPTGGMVHLHYILTKPGAPRFDLRAQRLQEHAEALRKSGLLAAGVAHCRIDDVVDFFAQYISEWNPNKNHEGKEEANYVAERVNEAQEHTASVSVEDMLLLLEDEMSEERHEYYKRAVRTEQMHDFHYPDPLGPPNPSQPCAKLLKGTLNMWYCGNGYPRDVVCEPCDRSVAQDALRPDLWRCNLCRNCPVMNSHMPAATVGGQSNTDAQPVVTKHQAEMYCCKYCAKHSKQLGTRATLLDVLDDMERKDASAKEKFDNTFEPSKLGSKLHRTFMAEIGEEMCQSEVAHHANKCPEYFCSRPEKQVHLYKKALALDTDKKNSKSTKASAAEYDWEGEEDDDDAPDTSPESKKKKLATKPSDLELYECRTLYKFPVGAGLSERLGVRETPEEQVAAASVYEFFRLVQFHGGKSPHLTWHDPYDMPIVTLSPVVRLREGPDFAFGARWALIQYHAWVDRREFLDMEDAAVKHYLREWIERPECPWYVKEQYLSENSRQLREVGKVSRHKKGKDEPMSEQVYSEQLKELVARRDYAGAAALQAKMQGAVEAEAALGTSAEALSAEEEDDEDGEAFHSDTEESSEEDPRADDETRVLKMLYKGNMEEVNRCEEQTRKAKVFNRRHDYYKHTRCTSTAQEEHSAVPAGVFNVNEDSEDDEAYFGEQKELAAEAQELRAAQHWVNQEGWDAVGEGRAVSPSTGAEVDLRIDWDDVKRKLAKGAGAGADTAAGRVDEDTVLRDFALDKLDPTQRAFAERVLAWAAEVASVYKDVSATGTRSAVPTMRTWLGGSAGSGKSTTLKTCVQHVRLLFQREGVDASVELTAYTGVAAFNIGFGARTACSSFRVFPKAAWKNELTGEAFRCLEEQWRNVVLLIVDEISCIGRAFFAKMHFRLQQAKRRFFSERALDPNDHTFGDISIILVGDFGQLEPIDDWSMCDSETTYQTCPKTMRHMWRHARQGKLLLQTFDEAVMLNRIHRSKDDTWWTESCLRLRDFACTRDDYDWWRQHDLDRGHLSAEQKAYFDKEAVWLCARCEDVGSRNGRKLAHMAEDGKLLVHKVHAHNSNKSARKQPSSAFDGLREVIHLVRGCKIMITRNVAYLYGLANGTRGKLVGVVYGPGGVGSLPEAIVVEVPDYCGPQFYPGEPTWVPLLPMFSKKEGTRMTREQFPVVAGFALTVNKAQGLTIKEGVVIHLVGGKRFRPAAKHGLPFVAWTRSESFALTAFKNLPPWADFVKGRDSDMLRMRLDFTQRLRQMHQRTLAKHSAMKTPALEAEAHERWSAQQAKLPKRQRHEGPRMPCPACTGYA